MARLPLTRHYVIGRRPAKGFHTTLLARGDRGTAGGSPPRTVAVRRVSDVAGYPLHAPETLREGAGWSPGGARGRQHPIGSRAG